MLSFLSWKPVHGFFVGRVLQKKGYATPQEIYGLAAEICFSRILRYANLNAKLRLFTDWARF